MTVRLFNTEWYPYFVKSRGPSIEDNYDPKDRYNVSMSIPNGLKTLRLFASYENVESFIKAINIPFEKWCFFEYILGDQKQKLYFDIDIDEYDGLETPENFATDLLDSLSQEIIDTFWDRGIDLSRDNIMIFSSNSVKKLSYHVIVNGYAVVNNLENKGLANEVFEDLPEIYMKYIDTSMWSSKQQFRTYKSQKPNSGRPKIYKGKGEFKDIFLASSITNTKDCVILESRGIHIQPKKLNTISNANVSFIKAKADKTLFRIYDVSSVKDDIIILRRLVPAHCTLCNRYHENENAYIKIIDSCAYFYCHGTKRHVKNGIYSKLICTLDRKRIKVDDKSVLDKLREMSQ